MQTIVDAVKRNIVNGIVQEDGCHALRNVAFHCGEGLHTARVC